jgi:hypothetical protein
MKEVSVYDLKLHESARVQSDEGITYVITRVPGGWIYQYTDRFSVTSAFVPLNNEFQIGFP